MSIHLQLEVAFRPTHGTAPHVTDSIGSADCAASSLKTSAQIALNVFFQTGIRNVLSTAALLQTLNMSPFLN